MIAYSISRPRRGSTKTASATNISEPHWKLFNSVQRGEAVIDWIISNTRHNIPNDVLGPIFWKMLREQWSGFDRIDHYSYSRVFTRFRPYWSPQPEWSRLPERLEVWRGGDRDSVRNGLSCTLERSVAENFAEGYRVPNKYPTLLRAEIDRSEVALVDDSREEHEVVLFGPLLDRAQLVPFTVTRP